MSIYFQAKYPFKPREDIQFLKSKDIGEVVAEACTQVYIHKPKHPIDFVGKWLLNYCKT